MIVHGIVSAQLDYCNSLLSGTLGGNFNWLQVVQNALARKVCRASWVSSVTELRRSLYWLPIRQRVEYKLAVITYNTIETNTPSTLASFIDWSHTVCSMRCDHVYSETRHVRSPARVGVRTYPLSAVHSRPAESRRTTPAPTSAICRWRAYLWRLQPINDDIIPEPRIFMCGWRCYLDAIEPAPVKLCEDGDVVMHVVVQGVRMGREKGRKKGREGKLKLKPCLFI